MRALTITLSSLLLSTGLLFAQNTNTNLVDANQNLYSLADLSPLGAGARSFDGRYQGVKGHPYLATGWLNLEVLLNDRDDWATISGNLDLVSQALVIGLTDGGMGSIPLQHISSVQVVDPAGVRHVEPHPLQVVTGRGNNEELALFEVLHDGEIRLLLELRKYFEEADYQGAYNNGDRFDSYSEQYSYYLKINGEYQSIRLRERPIMRALGSQAGRARTLIRQNNLDLGQQNDFIRLLQLLEE